MQTSDSRHYKRSWKNMMVEPAFQIRLTGLLVLGAVAHMAVVSAILFHFLQQNYEILVHLAGLDPDTTRILYRELYILIAAVSGTFLIYLTGIVMIGLVYSHRIAGVIYALKRTIRNIKAGHPAELHLRRRDEFRELGSEFNSMVKMLRDGEIEEKKPRARKRAAKG